MNQSAIKINILNMKYTCYMYNKLISKKQKNGFSDTLLNLVFTRCMVPWFQICLYFHHSSPLPLVGFPTHQKAMMLDVAMRPPRTSARLPRKVPLGPAAPRSGPREEALGVQARCGAPIIYHKKNIHM